jgi:hypothetical protein
LDAVGVSLLQPNKQKKWNHISNEGYKSTTFSIVKQNLFQILSITYLPQKFSVSFSKKVLLHKNLHSNILDVEFNAMQSGSHLKHYLIIEL